MVVNGMLFEVKVLYDPYGAGGMDGYHGRQFLNEHRVGYLPTNILGWVTGLSPPPPSPFLPFLLPFPPIDDCDIEHFGLPSDP